MFGSSSKILNEYPEPQKTHFFYLHTGAEVARIELPAWASEDREMLSRVHALAYDQSRKGNGYPLALAEAHELAVIRVAERDAFFSLARTAIPGQTLENGRLTKIARQTRTTNLGTLKRFTSRKAAKQSGKVHSLHFNLCPSVLICG